MSSTPFVSSDVDLLWSKDGSNVYFKLSNFSNSFQVYVEANHVDDATNAKLLMVQMLQMLKLLMLLMMKLVMLLLFYFHNSITLQFV